ncbi:g2290 [Coccomyxa elongata]
MCPREIQLGKFRSLWIAPFSLADRENIRLGQQPRQHNLRATKQTKLPLDDIQRTLLDLFQSEIIRRETDATESAHSLLLEAITQRKVEPDRVLGAMLFLEDQERRRPNNADLLSQLEGAWRLVFSGPSKFQFLSYIPVDEDFVIDSSDSSLKLESDLGPMRAKFCGSFQWRGSSNELDFSFTKAQVDLFGRCVWERDVAFKPKTYSYFWLRDDVACARSSGGTLTLMQRLTCDT